MKKSKSTILAAAISGLFLGSVTTSCGTSDNKSSSMSAMEKHACAKLNSCAGKGGCRTEKNACKGQNSCKNMGGCATVEKHSCKGGNNCKGQGGCKANGDCAGRNSCATKGGCAVPVKAH